MAATDEICASTANEHLIRFSYLLFVADNNEIVRLCGSYTSCLPGEVFVSLFRVILSLCLSFTLKT